MKGQRFLFCVLLFYFIILMTSSAEPAKLCEGIPPKCCSGYTWDIKNKDCVECPVGHIGRNCKMKCPFPTFGRFCQSLCTCDHGNCHFAKGCFQDRLPKTGTAKTTDKAETKPQLIDSVHNEDGKNESKMPTRKLEESNIKKLTSTDEGTKKTEKIRIGILGLVGLAGFLVALYVVTFICKRQNKDYKKFGDVQVFVSEKEAELNQTSVARKCRRYLKRLELIKS